MPLCGVATISEALLTYLLVSPFLFGYDGLAQRVSWLSGEVVVVMVALGRTLRTVAMMSERSSLISKSVL